MCNWRSTAALLLAALTVQAQAAYPGIGRPATAREIAAWDIDVRPDFKGLPAGAGTVARGMEIWESKCASCHGVFGESNEVFSPIIGGTTAADIASGRVARLTDPGFPGRTTLMKLSTVSTLWDYIRRAMPWNAPKSLSVDEVYAVTAYVLNLGGVVPESFTLTDRNIADVQARLPNREGTTTAHGLWPGRGFGQAGPDVKAAACMSDCAADVRIVSMLPDHARNAHGNLAEQNRLVGAQHGADTTRAPGAVPTATAAAAAAVARPAATPPALALTQRLGCSVCHGVENRIVGPGFRDVAKKHAERGDAVDYLVRKITSGGSGVWGAIPMPPQALSGDDAKTIAQWLIDGAAR
jgi:cytochrome c